MLICQHSGYLRVGANRCPLLQSRIMDGFTLPMPFGVVPSVMFPRFGPMGGLAMKQAEALLVDAAPRMSLGCFGLDMVVDLTLKKEIGGGGAET